MRRLTADEYKERLLNVILKIDRICRENGCWYSIIYGTLLGAVRHKGFIPWDDDIDIAMPRADLYKLGKFIEKHPEEGLNFIDISNRKDTIYTCAKVCDTATVVKESRFKAVEGYGVFVDVFALDNLPNDQSKRKKFKSRARYLARIIQHASLISPGKPHGLKKTILVYVSFIYSKFFSVEKTLQKLTKHCTKYNDDKTDYFGVPYHLTVLKKSYFSEIADLPFEGYLLKGPKQYDEVLRSMYRDPYTLPPENKRITHRIEGYLKD